MFLSVIAAILAGFVIVRGADIKLAWDANTETDLAGYNLYYGTTARTGTDPKTCTMCGYTTKVPLGKVTSYQVSGLTLGVNYFFSLTAFDTSTNESGFSNEVNGPAKDYSVPLDPKNMKIVP
jgi:hypothetical protein